MLNVLVVGGAGYIGSHMVLHLLNNNINVVVLDNLSVGYRTAVLGGHFYHGDMSDRKLLRKIFSTHDINVVMHFSAFIRVDESITKPEKYYVNNVCNTITLLQEMLKAEIKHMIFSSTAAIYGEPQYIPVNTEHPINPMNPYGQSKYMVECILRDYDTAYGLKSTVLRYFNAAGADQEGRIGYHKSTVNLIPQVLKVASGREEYLKIFGNDYPTKDGSCIRDYIHVMDLASAHLLSINKMLKEHKSAIYNLGTEKGFSVLDIVNNVEKITQKKIPIKNLGRRHGDPSAMIADANLAKKELGWNPAHSNIEKIILDSWQWEKIQAGNKTERTVS